MEIIFTTLVVFTLGSCFHFIHSIPHNGKYHPLDFFSAVNESTWEHMKLLILAVIVFTLSITSFYPEFAGIYLFSSLVGITLSTLTMPLIFYSYVKIIGRNYFLIDIGLFLLCSFIFAITFFFLSTGGSYPMKVYYLSLVLWVSIIILTIYWTYHPPKNELFRCPVSNDYGHKRH